ncbi:MAG: head-tail connector protein [Clostridia bacterium]|nr:head-tail connector protein [Clostridia bacterium]
MTLLERVKARLEISDNSKDALLSELILEATDAIKAFVNRDTLPEALSSAIVRLTVTLYNLQGLEGESSHSEGGVSVAANALPDEIKAMLRPYRLARTVSKCEQDSDS